MKKLILTAMTVAVVGAGMQSARAGDREWALAGKVLTGVAAAAVIGHALSPGPVYYQQPAYSYAPAPTVVYAAPAPVYAAPVYVAPPAPVVVYRAPVCVVRRPVVHVRVFAGGGRHYYRPGCW